MAQTAAVAHSGSSQAVRLPATDKSDSVKVDIKRSENDDVVLATRPPTWDAFIDAVTGLEVPDDFLPIETPDSLRGR